MKPAARPRHLRAPGLVGALFATSQLVPGCAFVASHSQSFVERVEPARATFLSEIGNGLDSGVTIDPNGYMIRSSRFMNVVYVAGRVESNGTAAWGVWSVGGGAPSGMPTSILAADDTAAQCSDFGRGDSSGEWIRSDDDVAELLAYAQKHG